MTRAQNNSGFSLKDQLFNRGKVRYLSELLSAAAPQFDDRGFVKTTMKGFKQLELKERIVQIAATLEKFLAPDYRTAVKHIVSALPPPLDPKKNDDDFGDFIFAPFGEYVVRNGLEKKYLKTSLRTIKELTKRFSMEDAIRSFINAHTSETLAVLDKWATDTNYHVRRLVSEGTRPLLPWSKRLSIEVTTPLPLLDKLHADSTRYVTRSVANHLNDIAKSNPKVVLETLETLEKTGTSRAARAGLDYETCLAHAGETRKSPSAESAGGFGPIQESTSLGFSLLLRSSCPVMPSNSRSRSKRIETKPCLWTTLSILSKPTERRHPRCISSSNWKSRPVKQWR